MISQGVGKPKRQEDREIGMVAEGLIGERERHQESKDDERVGRLLRVASSQNEE